MSSRVVGRNILSRLGAKLATYPLGLLASVLLIRYLGVERLGQYAYVSTFASLFALLAGAGLPILLTREAARDKASAGRLLGGVLALQYGLSALTVVTVGVSALVLNPLRLALPIAVAGVGVAVSALGAPYLAILNAFEKMHLSSAIEVLSTVFRVGLILAAIQLRLDVTGLVAILLLNPFAALFLTRLACERYCVSRTPVENPALLKSLLVSSLPFALMVIFNNVYYRVDIIMLEKIQGHSAVGIYAAGYKVIDVLMIIGANVAGVLYPRMAAQSGTPEALGRTLETTYRYLTALAIPVSVVVTVLAPGLVAVLFGSAFSESVLPLRILAWSLAPTFMYLPLAHALNAAGREWQWVAVLAINTVVNLVLNLVLIPAYGAVGAAASTGVCELVGLILVSLLVRRISRLRYLSTLTPVLAASAFLGIPLWYLGDEHVAAGLTLALAGYAAALHVFGFFGGKALLALRQAPAVVDASPPLVGRLGERGDRSRGR